MDLFLDTPGAHKLLNSKQHAVVDNQGRPLIIRLTSGQASDHIGAKLISPALLKGEKVLLGEKGYDSDEFSQHFHRRKTLSPALRREKAGERQLIFAKRSINKRAKSKSCLNA